MIVMTLFTLRIAWVAYAKFQLWQYGQRDLKTTTGTDTCLHLLHKPL